jgi:hypothetical protein
MVSSLSFQATGTQEQVTTVVVDVLVDQYGVEEDQVAVDVTSARRLVARRLQGSGSTAWQVDFEITANKEAVDDAFDLAASQADGTGDALSSFTSALSTAFQEVGVTLDASSISVSQPEIKVVTATMTTVSTTGKTAQPAAAPAADGSTGSTGAEASGLEFIAIGVAAVVGVLLAILLCFLLRRRHKSAGARQPAQVPDVEANNDNDNMDDSAMEDGPVSPGGSTRRVPRAVSVDSPTSTGGSRGARTTGTGSQDGPVGRLRRGTGDSRPSSDAGDAEGARSRRGTGDSGSPSDARRPGAARPRPEGVVSN